MLGVTLALEFSKTIWICLYDSPKAIFPRPGCIDLC